MKRFFGILLSAAMLMGLVSCQKSGALVPGEEMAPVSLKQSVYYTIDAQDSMYVSVLAFDDRNVAYFWEGSIEEMSRLSMIVESEEDPVLPEDVLKGTYTYDFNTASGSVEFPSTSGTFVISKGILSFSFNGNIYEMVSVEDGGYPHPPYHYDGDPTFPPQDGDEF